MCPVDAMRGFLAELQIEAYTPNSELFPPGNMTYTPNSELFSGGIPRNPHLPTFFSADHPPPLGGECFFSSRVCHKYICTLPLCHNPKPPKMQ